MDALSKSRLISFRQCAKRLWLEVHHPELAVQSGSSQFAFDIGNQVGAVARRIYDPKGVGAVLSYEDLGVKGILRATQELLQKRKPIFEAGFQAGRGSASVRSFADALLPVANGWRMVEVKSATGLKDYYREDLAIQHHVATSAGLSLRSTRLAHIDSTWTYGGDGNYEGLLKEVDLTRACKERSREVRSWIRAAHEVARGDEPPKVGIGKHCANPFECSFEPHCRAEDEVSRGRVAHPIEWLPRIQSKALVAHIEQHEVRSLADVPDALLNAQQLRVKSHSLSGIPFFDATAAAQALSAHPLPTLFLDFETISLAVPIWAGTRPYEKVPFQFSLHRLGARGGVSHVGFLDVSGRDPREGLAAALAARGGTTEPVFVYNRAFESSCLKYLAGRFPRLSPSLLSIERRLVDLLPVARDHYYHPDQQGSWSIKTVLPAIAPELRYADLEEVQDGGGAQAAYTEATSLGTTAQRRVRLQDQLRRYCRLDTWAMIVVWAYLSGHRGSVPTADTCATQELNGAAR